MSTEATKNVTTAEIIIPNKTNKVSPRGAITNRATTLPGDGVATKPVPVMTKVKTPDAPPAMTAKINLGCISI